MIIQLFHCPEVANDAGGLGVVAGWQGQRTLLIVPSARVGCIKETDAGPAQRRAENRDRFNIP